MWVLKASVYIFIILVLLSCEQDSFDPNNTSEVVVEAFLYAGEPVANIKISKLVPFIVEEGETFFINDADVTIKWNDAHYSLILSDGDSGYYHYPGHNLEILEGHHYEINFNYFDKQISAITSVPSRPQGLAISQDTVYLSPRQGFGFPDFGGGPSPNDNLEVYWDNPDRNYYYVLVENIEENPQSVDESGFFDENFPAGNFRFITQPTNLDVYNISGLSLNQYGTYKVKVFRVNQEYVDLYQTSEQDSRNLNEPLSNIENGLGVFTAFSRDSIYFEVVEEP